MDNLKIGYTSARCQTCGERYNGYSLHTCPQALGTANEAVLQAADLWARQFEERPRVKVDAALYDAVQAQRRSAAAEPDRLALKARMKALARTMSKNPVRGRQGRKSNRGGK